MTQTMTHKVDYSTGTGICSTAECEIQDWHASIPTEVCPQCGRAGKYDPHQYLPDLSKLETHYVETWYHVVELEGTDDSPYFIVKRVDVCTRERTYGDYNNY